MLKKQAISESELIQKCKHGDLRSQERLYKHFYGYAMGVGLRYLSNRDDSLEVVNDAFIKVFKSIGQFENERLFKPWLRRIIVNTAIDRQRKNMPLMYETNLEQAEHVQTNAAAIETLNAADIMKLLDALPRLQRVIFNMYEIDGYSHEEISKQLDIPASSSRVYLSRAKENLRKWWLVQNGSYSYTKTQAMEGEDHMGSSKPGANLSILKRDE